MTPARIHDYCLKLACTPRYEYFATVEDLPVELLVQIFIALAESSEEFPLASLILSQVCSFWRGIVLNLPQAWQTIYLDDSRTIHSLHVQADLWARQCSGYSLDIHIHLSDGDNLLPLLSPLLPHIRRWRRCRLTGKIEEDFDFAAYSEEGSLALLDNLSINIRGPYENDDPLSLTLPSRDLTFARGSPLHLGLHMSRFHRIFMNAEVRSLPLPRYMTALNLRSLIIREQSTEMTPDPIRLINFLSACPELKIFHYIGLPNEPAPPKDRSLIRIAHLPHLHTLVLHSTCAVRAILSHIHAPELTELYLEHTNMEFKLHHAAAYTPALEEGDSDDEAGDFSQSPWSDYATGMGLRSLIRRSRPPLEVLEMDYADMRTKDFLWCFDKLGTLQEFRIVASDMSDKVIAMLAPLRPKVDGMDIEDSPPVESSVPLRVRLPKLSALELWNCQRLSGDAVVDALGARVRYTDNVSDRNAYSRLSDVAVVNCANFLPRHVLTLSPVFGTRLRTTG